MSLKADFSSRTRASAPTTGQHADYQVNIQMAWKMHHKWKVSDSPEIWTAISDSQHNKKCLFTISFTPDKRAPMGKYSACVYMHQSKDSFMKECEGIRKVTLGFFNQYAETYKNEIPKWKQIDELYWQEFLDNHSERDLQKLVKNLGLNMKNTKIQEIKC